MLGYLVGKIVAGLRHDASASRSQLMPGLFLLDGLTRRPRPDLADAAWVLVLGLVATLPLGAILGSLFPSPRNMGLSCCRSSG